MSNFCNEWSDKYLTGDPIIDKEHQKIRESACHFSRLVEASSVTLREVTDIMKEVNQFVSVHTAHEELLMVLYNANGSDIEEHKQEHIRLRTILTAATRNLRDSACQPTEEFRIACNTLLAGLYELITEHIYTMDVRTLRPCISAHKAEWASKL